MQPAAIASLLEPYATGLTAVQLRQISVYVELLLQWNARMNLTAVRDAKNIVTRHFGESLFAARHLLPAASAIDLGSGAGFPGLPLKICDARLALTLIESQNKKVTFLREVVRRLELTGVEVFGGRAEEFAGRAELVTLRAVERLAGMLPVAAGLLDPDGRLALLIGKQQIKDAERELPTISWSPAIDVPGSARRVVLVGRKPG